MSRRNTKRKFELTDLPSDGDVSLVAAKKARMSSANRHKRLSLLDDYGASSGGRGKTAKQAPHSFFDRQREKRASDAIVAKFEAQIEHQAEAIRQVIASEENKLNEKRRDITSKLAELYEAILPAEVSRSGDHRKSDFETRKANHILHQEADEVTQKSRELITKFAKADEMIKSAELELPLDTWAQDKRDIADIMMCGRDYGLSIVEGLLAPGVYASPCARSRFADDNSDIAAGLFEKSKEALDEDNWGTVFEEQMKRFLLLANSVPCEAAVSGSDRYSKDTV